MTILKKIKKLMIKSELFYLRFLLMHRVGTILKYS